MDMAPNNSSNASGTKRKHPLLYFFIFLIIIAFVAGSYVAGYIVSIARANKDRLEQYMPTPTGVYIDTSSETVFWQGTTSLEFGVYIDSQEYIVSNSNYLIFSDYTQNIGTYSIKILARSTDGVHLDSEFSEIVYFTRGSNVDDKVLAVPSDLHIHGSALMWSDVPHATQYDVRLNNADIGATVDNSIEVGQYLTSAGSYVFDVRAVDTMGKYQDSAYASFVYEVSPPSAIKLDTPSNLGFDEVTNLITFDKVLHADQYNIMIHNNSDNIDQIVQSATNSLSVSFLNPSSYYFAVVATSNDTVNYTDSDQSAQYSFGIQSPPPPTQKPPLDTPSSPAISSDKSVISWENVANASQYSISINGTIKQSSVASYSFGSGELTADTVYTIKVKASPSQADNYSDSEWSSELVFTTDPPPPVQKPPLDTPSSPAISSDKSVISWGNVANASQYSISINGTIKQSSVASYSFGSGELTADTVYTIKVKASPRQADNYSDSEWSSELVFTTDPPPPVQKPPLDTPTISNIGSDINWTNIVGAIKYTVDIDGTLSDTTDNTMSLLSLTDDKTYAIRVRAIADPAANVDSEWSNIVNYVPSSDGNDGGSDGNNPETSPEGLRERIERLLPRAEYERLMPHRFGTDEWKNDADSKTIYTNDADRNSKTDYYSYDNFIKAATTLAERRMIIESRTGISYWHSERVWVEDKSTGKRIMIQEGAPDFDEDYNQDKPIITKYIDFGEFLYSKIENDNRRELAALLANMSHEVGNSFGKGSSEEKAKWGFYWNEELAYASDPNLPPGYVQATNEEYPPTEGKSYHGRGPIQISWNFNYGAFSQLIYLDKQVLLDRPELVTEDGALGYMSALWFWMVPQQPKASCHDVMLYNYKPPESGNEARYVPCFGLTIVIINGGYEGGFTEQENDAVADRINYYRVYAKGFGANIEGEQLDTVDMPPWG